MAMSKTQKKLAGVLAVGGLALGVDRFVLSDPAEASANDALLVNKDTPAGSGTGAAAGGGTGVAGGGPAGGVGVGKLEKWGAHQIGRRMEEAYVKAGKPTVKEDPFHFPLPPAPPVEPARSAATVAPVVEEERPGVIFARAHSVKAIFDAGKRGTVLISDRILREGDVLDGWRLVSIAPSSVLFERGPDQARLHLSDPAKMP